MAITAIMVTVAVAATTLARGAEWDGFTFWLLRCPGAVRTPREAFGKARILVYVSETHSVLSVVEASGRSRDRGRGLPGAI
jgi:hypothetical protein